MPEIQQRRVNKQVPGGATLHDYVNLYFHARNPMMYKRRAMHEALGVLVVHPGILDIPGTVIADCNAASDIVLFKPAPNGLEIIDDEAVYAESWTHDNPVQTHDHRLKKCAEVLVPTVVPAEYIERVYVSGRGGLTAAQAAIADSEIASPAFVENAHLFFR